MDSFWRKDITQQVREAVKDNKQIAEIFAQVPSRPGGIRSKAKWLKDQCEQYANRHNGNFGELFVAELDAAYWQELAREAENV